VSRETVVELAEQAGVDPDELVEWWDERAAIREVDGGQSREDAERGALEDIRELIAIGPWVLGERKGPRSAAPVARDAQAKRVK
jgi:hypothetical protein